MPKALILGKASPDPETNFVVHPPLQSTQNRKPAQKKTRLELLQQKEGRKEGRKLSSPLPPPPDSQVSQNYFFRTQPASKQASKSQQKPKRRKAKLGYSPPALFQLL
jgi:hypothetical protein